MKSTISNFSRKVYSYCSQIPKGKVSTYKYIAVATYGSSRYARTVGQILSKCECKLELNSYEFSCELVHCYRVINSDFSLGGFATEGGGNRAEIKRKILTSGIALKTKNR